MCGEEAGSCGEGQPEIKGGKMKTAEQKMRSALISRHWRERHPERSREASRNSERRRRTERREEWIATKRKWNAANRERTVLYARRALCKKHGISTEHYEAVFAAQGGMCGICGKQEEEAGRMFCIDHDHGCCPGLYGCNKCFRGIICSKCNQGMGCLQESAKIMLAAIAYLRKSLPDSSFDLHGQSISSEPDLPCPL